MTDVNPLDTLQAMLPGLAACRWRLPVLLAGDAAEVREQALRWLGTDPDVLWLSSYGPEQGWCLRGVSPNHELGREARAVVVDMFDGVAVDAIAALSGVIRAGGFMLFLGPPLSRWATYADPEYRRLAVEPYGPEGARHHFLVRLARRFASDVRVLQLPVSAPVDYVLPGLSTARQADEKGCLTRQQRMIVDAVETLFHHTGAKPLVVRADRGRGKSAALGIAAARILSGSAARHPARALRILVTAPRPEAVETLLRFARIDNVEAKQAIRFVAPDLLLQTLPPADLLLVDEAAALAPAMLAAMLDHYAKVVMATTVQGYEGTGQGFLIRFARFLNRAHPGWQTLLMDEPVRWAPQDPLECFINDALFLNACVEPVLQQALKQPDTWKFRELTPVLESLDESLLRSIYGLLASAHYRTRPSDLRTLLDGPNVRSWILSDGQDVLAVAMVAEEGQLPGELADAIAAGKRRPHGHVLAQSLAVHLNLRPALSEKSWRVVRIAVHSQRQRQGIGRWMLDQLEQQAIHEQIPLLGSLFASAPDVLAFWQHCGYEVVRLGINRESTSGGFPALVVKAVTESGKMLAAQARQRFEQNFLPSLADMPLPWPADLVLQAWRQTGFISVPDRFPADALDIDHFIAGHKTFENAAAALYRQVQCWFLQGQLQVLAPEELAVVIGKVLQKQCWETLIDQQGYTGQKQARARLRQAITRLWQNSTITTGTNDCHSS